jgi:type IV fimbrial biogenesis protein FimT
MVTVAIAGVLLALAMPAMQQFVTQKAVSSNSDELASALRFARSEALKRSAAVAICSSNGKTGTAAGCAGTSDWTQGWVVFVDRDGNGTYGGSDELLRLQPPMPGQVVGPTVDSANKVGSYVEFVGAGLAVSGAQTFTFRPNLSSSNANYTRYTRKVCVNLQGRTNVVSGSASCN